MLIMHNYAVNRNDNDTVTSGQVDNRPLYSPTSATRRRPYVRPPTGQRTLFSFAELRYVTDAILCQLTMPLDVKQTVSMRHHILQAISVLVVRLTTDYN